MHDTLEPPIDDILSSRPYRGLDLPAETVRALLAQELPRHRSQKDALKSVRQKLHNIVAPDFTVYSSKRADSIRSFEQDQIGGDKTWEYVIVPKTPGSQTIPALSFSYFNAEKNKYETVATAPIILDVVRGADSTSVVFISGYLHSSVFICG